MEKFKVNIRRDLAPVKPNAEQLDGKIYRFSRGWTIEDLSLYEGETAYLPEDENYPKGAPFWIASGDLEKVDYEIVSESVH